MKATKHAGVRWTLGIILALSWLTPATLRAQNNVSVVYQPTTHPLTAFITGAELYDKYYNKTTGDWTWESQGLPGGSTPVGLSAVYQPTVRPLVVFVDGSDGNLYDKYYDAGWKWQSQGNPGVPVYGTSAVFDASSGQIVDFVAGQGNGHLYSLTGNGTAGTWKDHGTPTSTSKTQYCCATVYQPTSHPVAVFLTANDGHLHDRYWNGSKWVWEDQGVLPGGIDSVPSAVDDPSNGQIHVFLTGADGNLYDRYWDGSGWTWLKGPLPDALFRIFGREFMAETYASPTSQDRAFWVEP